MRLAPAIDPLQTAHACAPGGPDAPGATRYVATVNDRHIDYVLTSAGAVGDATGYADLATATAAAREASRGVSTSAIAVLEHAGRFYDHALTGTAYIAGHPGTDLPPEPFTLPEWLVSSGQADRLAQLSFTHDKSTRFPTNAELRSVVDGAVVIEFH